MRKKTTRREDYLKLIYTLSKTKDVHGVDLARALDVSKPTVSIFLKQLTESGFVYMDAHRVIHLTEKGLAIAESTQDKHSTLCTLLESLGVPGDIAALDACAIEHNLSNESYEALKQLVLERQLSM